MAKKRTPKTPARTTYVGPGPGRKKSHVTPGRDWDKVAGMFVGDPRFHIRGRKGATAGKPKAPPAGTPGSPGSPGSPTPTPTLTPEQQQDFNDRFYDLLGKGIESDRALSDVQAMDPAIRAQIEENYRRARRGTSENLAARGLTATGVNDAQLWDVNRSRQLATIQQDRVLANARQRHDDITRAINSGLQRLGDTRTVQQLINLHDQNQNVVPPTAPTPAKPAPAAPAKPQPTIKPISKRKTTYVGPGPGRTKSHVTPGRDWAKVAPLFTGDSRYHIRQRPAR